MSSSPKEQTTVTGSPQRFHNRYSDRYQSLINESPPRDFNALKTPERPTSNLKNSPLRSNRVSEHRIFEGEKYTALIVKNEDRGEWREKVLFNEENVDEVEQLKITKPQQSSSHIITAEKEISYTSRKIQSSPKPSSSYTLIKEEQEATRSTTPTSTVQQQQHHHRRGVPHYMQATSSFESRAQYNKERRSQSNLLGPRSKGGITKRVGTTKVPRYKATTTINAIEDIQSEMQPEDVYIPMAARIKLFEKGLGNGSNKPVRPTSTTSSTSTNSSQPKRQPSRSTSTRTSPTPSDSSLPGYARGTVSSETKERKSHPATSLRGSTSSRSIRKPEQAKPIASSEQSFNERLNLWKGKDKIATMESYNKNRGIKRKSERQSRPMSSKHYK